MLREYHAWEGGPAYIQVPWTDEESYTFVLDEHIVKSAPDPDESEKRMKDVYIGTFEGDDLPKGIEAGRQYCLKIISTNPGKLDPRLGNNEYGVSPNPSVREQYDLYEFQGRHFRRFCASNPAALKARQELKENGRCREREMCCVVEPIYSVLAYDDADPARSEARAYERMTVWERVEFIRQYIEAVLELQDDKNRINGRRVLAQRDAKVQNALIIRELEEFQVVLVDMASILFEQEQMVFPEEDARVYTGKARGPMGTGSIIYSPANTPPEVVIPGYPIGEKVDVFALGGLLASLFGYCKVENTLGNRNPIATFHHAHYWPSSASNSHGSVTKLVMSDFRPRYQNKAAWDRNPENAGKSWLEEDLKEKGYTFCWGKEPQGIYEIPPHILEEVKAIFRDCTRIHPDDRIDLRQMYQRVAALQAMIPVSRDFCNEKLYRAREVVHLYDLGCVNNSRQTYELYTMQEFDRKRRAVRCDGYALPEDYLYDDQQEPFRHVFREKDKLREYVKKLSADHRTNNGSPVYALIRLYLYYQKFRDTALFDGEIRFFTRRKVDEKTWQDYVDQDGQRYSCTDVLDELMKLTRKNIEVRICCPEKPYLPDERMRWEPISPLERGSSTPQSGKAKNDGTEHAVRQEPPAEIFVRGMEGLYFLCEGRKVYVARKRR